MSFSAFWHAKSGLEMCTLIFELSRNAGPIFWPRNWGPEARASIASWLIRHCTDVAHYNFNADQPILIIFGRQYFWRLSYHKPIEFLMSVCCVITKAEMMHLSFQSCCILCLDNDAALACYESSTSINQF